MRILFAGTPEFAVPSLRAVAAAGHEIVGVITRDDAPLGRKRVLTPSPVAQVAAELGIETFKTNRLGDEATEWARRLKPDLGVIVAYGGLVREPLLRVPTHGWINLHFSDLPRWRGAAPVQRALQAGEQTLGVTVFRLVEALDAGDVLARDARTVQPGTTAGEALVALAEDGTTALREAIHTLEVNPDAGTPQIGEATYAHKLTRDDGKLDLSRPASEVLAHWAGVTPEPGAFALLDGGPVKLNRLAVFEGPQVAQSEPNGNVTPGTVRLVGGKAVLELQSGALELVRVQPAGKPEMAGADWLRGRGGEAVLA